MRIDVENSSNVKAMEFLDGVLTVTFGSGMYRYEGVDEVDWEALVAVWQDGGSMGTAFNIIIRGKYKGEKVVADE